MVEWYMTPGFVYDPRSPLYGRERGDIPLPYLIIGSGSLRKYLQGGEAREAVIKGARHLCATELRGKPAVGSITVYDDIGNVLHVWTRADLGV
jgi:hypothetical protein